MLTVMKADCRLSQWKKHANLRRTPLDFADIARLLGGSACRCLITLAGIVARRFNVVGSIRAAFIVGELFGGL